MWRRCPGSPGIDPAPSHACSFTGKLTRQQADALRDLARRTGLPDTAAGLLGVVEAEQLAALYESSELVLVPTFAEGFSIPVVEALRRDTPVVVSDIKPHRELVGDGPWLAAPDDVAGLTAAIAHVRANRDVVVETQQRNAGNAGDTASTRKPAVDGVRDVLRDRRPRAGPRRRRRLCPEHVVRSTQFLARQRGVWVDLLHRVLATG